MNRIFKKPEFYKLPKGAHVHAMQFELPATMSDLDPAIGSFCRVFYESCREHNNALASVMYGFVQPDGAMPYLCDQIAKTLGVESARMSIAIIATMGCKFVRLEIEQAREDLKKSGMSSDDPAAFQWIRDRVSNYSFSQVCSRMSNEITCDCPACVMFWVGRQVVVNGENVGESITQLCEFINKETERHGPGCVKHLIPNSDKGKWIDPDDDGSDQGEGE